MKVTRRVVLAYLDSEEPNYLAAARLGQAALPYLERIVEEEDPFRSPEAVYLASLIDGSEASRTIFQTAARCKLGLVRTAAGAALRNLRGDVARELFEILITDVDEDVKHSVLCSALGCGDLRIEIGSGSLRAHLQEMERTDRCPWIRDLAAGVLGLLDIDLEANANGDRPRQELRA